MSFHSTELPLDPNTDRLLRDELKPGETVLWKSAPLTKRHLMAAMPVFVFAIPWTAFAVFWMTMASRGSATFALFGLPFVGIGLAMMASPWWAARRARRIGYAITTDRVLIITPEITGGVTVRSFTATELGDLERVQRGDGSGDLILQREWVRGSKGRQVEQKTGFIGIPDVREVQTRLEAMVRANQTPPASAD